MNLQQLKQRLSLQNVWQSLQRVVLRFPVAVGLMVSYGELWITKSPLRVCMC